MDSDGAAFIVTNEHVINGSDEITVRVGDATDYAGALLGFDEAKDLAVVWICCSEDFYAVPLADTNALPSGSSVYAMGYPLGIQDASVTRGIVSRTFDDEDSGVTYVQTDTPINPGNSGGPLFSLIGEVVGINTSGIRRSLSGVPVEGFGFAISSATVAEELPTLQAVPGRTRAVGPVERVIPHSLSAVGTRHSGFWGDDMRMVATFRNPYDLATGGWDYGFQFRASKSEGAHFVGVDSGGRWFHYLDEGGESRRMLADGPTPAVNTGTGTFGANRIHVIAYRNHGWLLVNSLLVAVLDLSSGPTSGGVRAFTGYLPENRVEGASTQVRQFEVKQGKTTALRPGAINHCAAMSNEANEVTRFIAHTTLINPSSGDAWEYRIQFGATHQMIIDSDGAWQHRAREGTFPWEQVNSGNVELGQRPGAANRFLLAVWGDSGWLYLNGKIAARLDLGKSAGPGTVTVRASAVHCRDSLIWSLD